MYESVRLRLTHLFFEIHSPDTIFIWRSNLSFFLQFFSCPNYLADLSVSNFLDPRIYGSEENFESFQRCVTTVQHNYSCILLNKVDGNGKIVGNKIWSSQKSINIFKEVTFARQIACNGRGRT